MIRFQNIARQIGRCSFVLGLAAIALSAGRPAHAQGYSSFAGCWNTNYGPVTFKQSGTCVQGCYANGGATICGQVCGNVLTGQWVHGCDWGYCQFTQSGNGYGFSGCWTYSNGCYGNGWSGQRYQPSFQAAWDTSYGRTMLFVGSNGSVFGQFNYSASAGGYLGRIDGRVSGNVMEGTWQNGSSRGKVRFILSGDGAYFQGYWWDAAGNYGGTWN